jgi:hypothetical protein
MRLPRRAGTLIMHIVAGCVLLAAPVVTAAGEPAAWRQEFDAVCGRTLDAEGMTEQELASLVDRCDLLRPSIEHLEETERKVFLRRLQLCCDLYRFMLDFRRTRK